MWISVQVTAEAHRGDRLIVLLRARSAHASAQVDGVRAIVTVGR